ncbi:hypothetical protein OPQ81_005249 [Rhizoctonia solani]|nr:hypothetical protein OPQ81_005249 [Rhizoctonia solani]
MSLTTAQLYYYFTWGPASPPPILPSPDTPLRGVPPELKSVFEFKFTRDDRYVIKTGDFYVGERDNYVQLVPAYGPPPEWVIEYGSKGQVWIKHPDSDDRRWTIVGDDKFGPVTLHENQGAQNFWSLASPDL